MGRKKLISDLNIFLNSEHIGRLTKKPNNSIEFSYSETWVKNGFPISLSLPLTSKKITGGEASYYFDNLLPENKKILDSIAQKFRCGSTLQFDILKAVGSDCVGALSFYPVELNPNFEKKMKARALTNKEIAKKIENLSGDFPLGMDEGDFRISIAGAQEKMAMLQWNDKWWEPQGSTPTSHIVKKPIGKILGGIDFHDSVENEYLGLEVSEQLGAKTCEAKILKFEDRKALIVKRFDRVWKDGFLLRIPQEDICQSMGHSPLVKYERDGGPGLKAIMDLLKSSNNAIKDRKSLFRLAMINDLLHNTDGHSKNVSIYLTRKGFALTPFYDIMSAHFLKEVAPDRYKALRSSWSVNGKFHFKDIKITDWQEQAKLCEISGDFDEIWQDLKSRAKALRVDHPQIDCKLVDLILSGLNDRIKYLER